MSKNVENHIANLLSIMEADGTVTVKRKFAVLAVMVLVCTLMAISYSAVGAATAVNPVNQIKNGVALFVSSPVAFVNGRESQVESTDWKVVPYEKNEQIMVPVRIIAQSLGAKVSWDNKSATATVILGRNKISLTTGSSQIEAGTITYPTAVPIEVVKGRTFVHVNPFVQSLGKKMFYDSGLIIIGDRDLEI